MLLDSFLFEVLCWIDQDNKKTVLINGFLSGQEKRIKMAYLLSSRFFVASTNVSHHKEPARYQSETIKQLTIYG